MFVSDAGKKTILRERSPPAWLGGEPRIAAGRAGLVLALLAALVSEAMSLQMAAFTPPATQVESVVWGIELVLVFPVLALVSSVGELMAVCLWLVPCAYRRPSVDRRARLLRVVAPAAVAFAAAGTLFTIFQVLFPPEAMGGHQLPPSAAFVSASFGWLFLVLAIPYTWWQWNMVAKTADGQPLAWHRAMAAIPWVRAALLASGVLMDMLQDWLLRDNGAATWVPRLWPLRILTELSDAWLVASLVVTVASLVLLALLPARACVRQPSTYGL